METFSLHDVARILGVKPYRVNYAIVNGLVDDPEMRVGNRRIFKHEDLERLAAHFGVVLREQTGKAAETDAADLTSKSLSFADGHESPEHPTTTG